MVVSPSVCSLQLCESDVRTDLNVRTGESWCWARGTAQDQLGGGGGRTGGEGEKGSWSDSQGVIWVPCPDRRTARGDVGAQPESWFCCTQSRGWTLPRTPPPPLFQPRQPGPTLSKRELKSHATATNGADGFYTCIQPVASSIFKCKNQNVSWDGRFHRTPYLQVSSWTFYLPQNATAQGCKIIVRKENFQLIFESSTTFLTAGFVFTLLRKHTLHIKIFNVSRCCRCEIRGCDEPNAKLKYLLILAEIYFMGYYLTLIHYSSF